MSFGEWYRIYIMGFCEEKKTKKQKTVELYFSQSSQGDKLAKPVSVEMKSNLISSSTLNLNTNNMIK